MKYQRTLLLSASCFFLAFLCSIVWWYQKDKNLTDRISPQLLRFHVLANSNSAHDQELKAAVKSLILEELQDSPADSKESFRAYIKEHRDELEYAAEAYLKSQGCSYGASILLTQAYFPTKAYGSLVLPCGVYDTVQVRLGQARGRNWWCVLYPRLCFVDRTHALLPPDSEQELRLLLSEDDYHAIMKPSGQVHLDFKLLELFGKGIGQDFAEASY